MEDTLWAGLTDEHIKLPMALTAEKLAEMYGVTRLDCDEFALQSQHRWGNGNYYLEYNCLLAGSLDSFLVKWQG